MSDYMSQTNRTILFEEFNSEITERRLDLILEEDGDDHLHSKVKDQLLVRSFDEFMEKFAPKYYECTALQTDPDTGQSYPLFTYTLKKPNSGNYEEKDIRLQPFYKAIMSIYENKGGSGENDFKFSFKENLDKLYDPEQAMEDARSIRRSLQYHYNECLKLEAQNASDEEYNLHAQKFKDGLRTIRDEYISQSQFNLIPLLIQDTKERLDILNVNSDSGCEDSRLETIPIKAITFNKSGAPVYQIERSVVDNEEIIQRLESKGNVLLLEDKSGVDTVQDSSSAAIDNKGVSAMLSNLFDKTAENGKNHLVVPGDQESTAFMKEMLVSVFTGVSSKEMIPKEELKNNLEIYELMYRASQENFAKGVVRLVEKLVNIRSFFDNAGGKAELIVSNCGIETLMSANKQQRFTDFIKAEGENYTSERIWFAIIPGVWNKDVCREDTVSGKIDISTFYIPDDDEDEDDIVSNTSMVDKTLMNTAKRALRHLSDSSIITFFNFKGCDSTSSSKLSVDTVASYKSSLSSLDPDCKKYSVFCYPNFTVLPKRSTKVTIGNDTINLPPVYIDASYIACGLYVASQNMAILKERGFRINSSLEQPVRFNFEGKFATSYGTNEIALLNHVFHTNMNREKIMPWSPKLMEAITSEGGFGFCFCGNEMHYTYKGKNNSQTNAYVLRARTLQKDKVLDENSAPTGEERYRPIFKTMIEIYIKMISKNMSKDQLKAECRLWCEGDNKQNINNIVHSVESAGLSKTEQISLDQDMIRIVYDRDRDDFDVGLTEL